VVGQHPVGQRRVDAAGVQRRHQLARQHFGYLAGLALSRDAEVAHRLRAHADAERRHQVVEEAGEMVGAEHDHQLRIELAHSRRQAFERIQDRLGDLVARLQVVHERRVRRADQHGSHGVIP
jgi:hypothetical protein